MTEQQIRYIEPRDDARLLALKKRPKKYLMSGRSLSDNNVTRASHHSHAIRIKQLAIAFAAFAKLELETSLLVKNLDTMVIGVSHHNVILGIDSHARGLGKLAF